MCEIYFSLSVVGTESTGKNSEFLLLKCKKNDFLFISEKLFGCLKQLKHSKNLRQGYVSVG